MNRRTTEDNNHEFQKNLYSKLNAFDLQGITMNANRDKFTIGVEYFDLSFEEYQQVKHQDSIVYQIKGMLPFEHIKAQVIFTESLNVPLYYIWGYEDYFLLHELYRDNDKIVYKPQWMNTEQLVNFWRKHKRTIQTHPFDKNGAKTRAGKTRIDGILEANGLEWGGNIDGFIINNNKVIAIIDCISIGIASQRNTHDLTDPKADPAIYFKKRGPKYTTWLSTIILARALNVPHLLFTLNKVDTDQEAIGLAGVDFLTRERLNYYQSIAPNQNVVYRLDNIINTIFNLITQLKIPHVL
ncbi:hypothetical protein [Enterococcus casseliflavus]|uniref:hypothetical protein n=1 Tax=Enterococcus casseliflavus TaxID=37734 RepID=UPI0022E3A90F|nr:hypothetical protein [Enterococcus casseliflavus]